jgi:hypothetical protein
MAITTVVIGAVAVGGGYLAIDHFMHTRNPESAAGGNKSSLEMLTEVADSAAAAIKQGVTPASAAATSTAVADVPAVKVGMPTLATSSMTNAQLVDAGNNRNNNLMGIAALCREILCNNVGDGHVAATFASCEAQNGSLANNCYNCSLFNIHWRSADPYPRVRIGSEIMPSFRTGRPSDVEGFRECIRHFKAFLERRSPAALAAIRAGNFDAFQIAIGQINYSPGYTNTISGGAIRPGRDFMRQRYARLRAAGLL